jgi:hypothetical protein
MSGRLMKQLMEDTKGLWEHPAQYSTIQILCWENRDDLGYAEVSANDVARLIGLGRRRVFMIYDELEALLAVTRLEPGDHGKAHAGTTQKFAVTLDRALTKRAADAAAACGKLADSTNGVVIPASPGWCNQLHQGGEVEITRVVQPASPGGDLGITTGSHKVLRDKYQEYKAAARLLPLLGPLPGDDPRVAASMRAAQAFQTEKLRNRVRGIARTVLLTPALGASLLNSETPPTNPREFLSAVERACFEKAKRDVRLRGFQQVVAGLCSSEWFKYHHQPVIRGEAVRPRDLARRRRES